jgi:hypothetical protein
VWIAETIPLGATTRPAAPFSWMVLLTLVVALAASIAVFFELARRWSSHRRWIVFQEWAQNHRFKLRPLERADLPPPIASLESTQPVAELSLSDDRTTLLQLQTDTTPGSRKPERAARWNILARKLDPQASWPPTGLRPVSSAVHSSLIDLFNLSSFPSLSDTERFVVFGTETSAARALSQSMARALVPADIGLLLHGQYLLLDFSARHFDTIEFGRMLALAEQVAQHVTTPAVT